VFLTLPQGIGANMRMIVSALHHGNESLIPSCTLSLSSMEILALFSVLGKCVLCSVVGIGHCMGQFGLGSCKLVTSMLQLFGLLCPGMQARHH